MEMKGRQGIEEPLNWKAVCDLHGKALYDSRD